MEPLPQTHVDLVKLRELLPTCFNDNDLRDICFDLHVNYEELPGETITAKSRSLVEYLARRGRIRELIEKCQKERSNVAWWDVLETSVTPLPSSTQPLHPTPSSIQRWYIFVGIVVALIFGGLLGFFLSRSMTVESPPPVSLVSLRYILDNFDPRMIDLRTASSSGIPATPGQALRLLDIWFSVPENAPAYGVQAEIYANNQLIGSTSLKPLVAGTAQLGDVLIERYNHGTVRQAWSVQPDWKDLLVFLITYRDGKVADRNLTMIHLDASGTAWLLDPPNLNFASIIYAVSDGPALILDLRDAEKAGLSIRPGDKLTLMEIWYDSNADSDLEVHAEAYMSSKGFDSSTFQATQSNVIQKGIHKLDPTPLSWTIPDSKQFLVVTLVRSDNAVTDRLILPLKPEGNPGLIRPP